MRVRNLVLSVVMLAVFAACDSGSDDGEAPRPGAAASAARPALPDGWRWESFRDVAVGVPGDWGYGGYGRWSAWCADGVTEEPAVGRPGGVFDILCWDPKKGGTNPGSLVANTGPFVAFALGPDLDLPEEGDRTIVRAGSGGVVIQAPADLRAQIATTVHAIAESDFNSCPLDHPITADAAYRPRPLDAAAASEIEAITVCKYPLPGRAGQAVPGPSLMSSLRLEAPEAQHALAAMLAAPTGGGPNRSDPKKCALDYGYGFEAYVVRIERPGLSPAEVVVHYSGCTHNGIDDGQTVRTLTAESLAWLVAEPNTPSGFIGDRGMPGLMARARALAAIIERHPNSGGVPALLRTHCGILSTTVANVLWLADPPLLDDSHNPPPGWENPETPGVFIQRSDTEAVFTAAGGLTAAFKRAPPGTADPYPPCD